MLQKDFFTIMKRYSSDSGRNRGITSMKQYIGRFTNFDLMRLKKLYFFDNCFLVAVRELLPHFINVTNVVPVICDMYLDADRVEFLILINDCDYIISKKEMNKSAHDLCLCMRTRIEKIEIL